MSSPPPTTTILDLPPELFHVIAFESRILSVRDIVALGSTCKPLYYILIADAYAASKLHATLDLTHAVRYSLWWGALAILRGAADPDADTPTLVSDIAPSSHRARLLSQIRDEAAYRSRTGPQRVARSLNTAALFSPFASATVSAVSARILYTRALMLQSEYSSSWIVNNGNANANANASSSSSSDAWRSPFAVGDVYKTPCSAHEFVLWSAVSVSPASLGKVPALRCARILLDSSLEKQTWDMAAALELACAAGNIDAVALILDEPAPPLSAGDFIVLDALATANEAGALTRVLAHELPGADFVQANRALAKAARVGAVDALAVLLADHRVDPTATGQDALLAAARANAADSVCALLADPRVDPTVRNGAPLAAAAAASAADAARALLADPRVDVNAADCAAFRAAAANGDPRVLAVLLTDPATTVVPAMCIDLAVNNRAEALAVVLGDPRWDPGADDSYALCHAADIGAVEASLLLIADPRVDPAARDSEPLVAAACNGHATIVAALLATGRVDVSVQDHGPEAYARDSGHNDLADFLARFRTDRPQHSLVQPQ